MEAGVGGLGQLRLPGAIAPSWGQTPPIPLSANRGAPGHHQEDVVQVSEPCAHCYSHLLCPLALPYPPLKSPASEVFPTTLQSPPKYLSSYSSQHYIFYSTHNHSCWRHCQMPPFSPISTMFMLSYW